MSAPNLQVAADGTVVATVPGAITAIGLENLVDVVSHEITREAGLTLHLIRFRGGGQFRLFFGEDGTLHECGGTPCDFTITPDNRVIVRAPRNAQL